MNEKCIGPHHPFKAYSLSGRIKLIDPKMPYPMKFEGSDIVQYFVAKDFKNDTNNDMTPNILELQMCINEALHAYELENTSWTINGYYKPALKGNNFNTTIKYI